MTARSKKSDQQTLWNTTEFISSQEFPDGITRSISQAGAKPRSGQDRPPASLIPQPGSDGETPTSGTSGRTCSGSSASAGHRSCSASKWRRRFGSDGWMKSPAI